MALCGVVHDRVVARDDAVQQPGVADVAHDELHAVGGQPRDVLGVAGVGQLVQDGDVDLRVVLRDIVHEVAHDDDVLGIERFSQGLLPIRPLAIDYNKEVGVNAVSQRSSNEK